MHLVSRHEEWLVGDDPFYLKFWAKLTHPLKNDNFLPTFAPIASATKPIEKSSIITNGKSTTRFPMNLRCTAYVASKSSKGGSKMQSGLFSNKTAFFFTKVCYKLSLCENFQMQRCNVYKRLAGDVLFYLKF